MSWFSLIQHTDPKLQEALLQQITLELDKAVQAMAGAKDLHSMGFSQGKYRVYSDMRDALKQSLTNRGTP